MRMTAACSSMILLLCTALIALSQAQSVSNKPHIVFFLIDDLGYNDIGYHDSTIVSPTIDRLASEGMILENNYVAPVCGPSRAALLTGKLPWTVGQQHGVLQCSTPDCLTAKYPLLQEALRDQGYRNYMLGKWHEGFCRQNCTPRARGFDEFHGYYNGYISHFEHKVDGAYDFRLNEKPDTKNSGKYAATVLGNTAVDYIKTHASQHSDKPLFMYFAFPTVHTPMEAPEEELNKFDDKDVGRRGLKAMMKITDDIIANVVNTLKQHGMYDNSVIIFSSDNGGEAGFSLNKPLRGAKATVWEGGVRVPGFIHSPLMTTSKGKVSKELFHQTDWYPTLMSLAGGRLHDALDGFDQSNFILHGSESARKDVALHYDQYYGPAFGRGAVRSGKWKLIKGFPGIWNGYDSNGHELYMTHTEESLIHLPAASQGCPSGQVESLDKWADHIEEPGSYNYDFKSIFRYADKVDNSVLLFDLEADPTETTDVAEDNPFIVIELKNLLQTYANKAVSISKESTMFEPASNPHNDKYKGFWGPGWC